MNSTNPICKGFLTTYGQRCGVSVPRFFVYLSFWVLEGQNKGCARHLEDYKQQFGETRVFNLSENEITKYTYEDELVSFTWYVSKTQFNFRIENKTNHSIKIPWDDIVFINPGGRSMRVIHSGVRFVDRNAAQAPSVVAKNSALDDILVPSDYIYYVDDGGSGLGGWKMHDVFHNYEWIGAEASVVFPIVIENVTNEYTFRFLVNNVYKK